MSSTRDRICIDKGDRELYAKLQNQEDMFKGKTRKEQFLFAMSIGVKNDMRQPLTNRETGGFFLLKDLGPEDEALINIVAVLKDNSASVLSDQDEVCKIAEEYAHAGIKLLIDKIESSGFGSFDKQFEKELHELHSSHFENEGNKSNEESIIS